MDTSNLYTGGSSASFAGNSNQERRAKELERKQEAQDKRLKLLPSEEIVMAEFDTMIAEAKNLDNIKVPQLIELGDRSLEIEMLANYKLIEHLKGAKVRLQNAMRDNK